jgi:hypothetical protein
MSIDCERLLKHPRLRKALTKEMLSECEQEEGVLLDQISEEAETVFTLGWDGDHPGGSGFIWVTKWNDFFFFGSSDYDDDGPYDSLEETLEDERFHVGTAEPSITSESLSLPELLRLASDLVSNEGDSVIINDQGYTMTDGKLVATYAGAKG